MADVFWSPRREKSFTDCAPNAQDLQISQVMADVRVGGVSTSQCFLTTTFTGVSMDELGVKTSQPGLRLYLKSQHYISLIKIGVRSKLKHM